MMKGTVKSFKKTLRSAFLEGVDRVRRNKRGYSDEHTSDDYNDVSEDFEITLDMGGPEIEDEGVSQSKRRAHGYKGEEPTDHDVSGAGMYPEAFDLDEEPPAKEIDEVDEDEDEEMVDLEDEGPEEDEEGEDLEDSDGDEEEGEDIEEQPEMPTMAGLSQQSTTSLDSPMKQLKQKAGSLTNVAKVVSAMNRAMEEMMPSDMSSTDRKRVSTWLQSKAKMMQSPGGMPSLKGTAKEVCNKKKKVNQPE